MSTPDPATRPAPPAHPNGHRPRAAVVETQAMHDETVPSLIDVLLGNGVEPTAFLNSRMEVRGDVLSGTPHGARVHYRPMTTPDDWRSLVEELRGFDLLVLNSFPHRGPLTLLADVGLPAVGVVHNPRLVLGDDESLAAVRSGALTPVTLAPHVTAWMMAEDPRLFARVGTLGAWMWPVSDGPADESAQRRRITVPGGVSFGNREFPLVLDTLPSLIDRVGADRFVVSVVGGGGDRGRLEHLVAKHGLGDVFDFAPVDRVSWTVPSDEYYPRVAASTFLLPLLPEDAPAYRVFKITGAVPTSVGFGLPAIIDRWTATVYDLPGVTYPVGHLADGLTAAVAMPDDELEALRHRLARRRTAMVERATEEMGAVLRSLDASPASGSPTPRPRRRHAAPSVARPRPVEVDRDDREAFLAFAELVLPRSHAPRLQDLWVLWESGFVTDGWFLELAERHPRGFSSTHLAEQLGWRGVSVPPPVDPAGVEHTLVDLLAEAGAPAVVDHLSLAAGAADLPVLAGHPFDDRPFRTVTLALNVPDRVALHDLLTGHGYRRVWPELSGNDDWYAHEPSRREWSAERLPALLDALGAVRPFRRRLALREALVDDLRDTDRPPAEVLGLPYAALAALRRRPAGPRPGRAGGGADRAAGRAAGQTRRLNRAGRRRTPQG